MYDLANIFWNSISLYYFCSCETCHYWFHFECVGVTHNDECVIREDVPYYCPTCCKPKKKLVPSRERKSNPPSKSSRKRKHPATKENDSNSLVSFYIFVNCYTLLELLVVETGCDLIIIILFVSENTYKKRRSF